MSRYIKKSLRKLQFYTENKIIIFIPDDDMEKHYYSHLTRYYLNSSVSLLYSYIYKFDSVVGCALMMLNGLHIGAKSDVAILTINKLHINTIKYFVHNIIFINISFMDNFHIACKVRNLSFVKRFYDNYENRHGRNDRNSKILKLSAKYGHLSIVKFLLSKKKYESHHTDVVKHAIENGDLAMLRVFKKHGFSLKIPNNYAMRTAAEFGHLDIIKYLVNNNVDVRSNENFAYTTALKNKRADIIEYIKSIPKKN